MCGSCYPAVLLPGLGGLGTLPTSKFHGEIYAECACLLDHCRPQWRREGWRIELIYLALPNMKLSLSRVAERVAHGGHDIPRSAIERRFSRSLYNLFTCYTAKADRTQCHLNSGDVPVLVFIQGKDHLEVLDEPVYRHLRSEAGL